MPTPVGFPPARARQPGRAVLINEKFGRYESTGAEVTLADTDATIIDFSGRPDMIVLHARTNGALVTLTDKLNREEDEVVVHGDERVEVRIGRERVIARNLAAGANAAFFVEAYYAVPDEPGRGD